MSNIIKFEKPDFLGYIVDDSGNPVGVGTKEVSFCKLVSDTVYIEAENGSMTMDEANQFCIAWLALHNPEVLNFDDEVQV